MDNQTDNVRQWNFAETLRREMSTDCLQLDKEKRTVALSFSSEMPVSRGVFDEVLMHDPEHMDLSRLNDAHPLLLGHDPERQIGVVESAGIGSDKKGRATVRFSRSPLGEEIWADVQDGIRRLVSVGYRRTKEVSSEKIGDREVVRFAWQPYEISIVSVPADASVGIGRNQTLPEAEKKVTVMAEEIKPDNRAKEILAVAKNLVGKITGDPYERAHAAIEAGKTVEQFREECLSALPEVKPLQKPILADVNPKDWARYSITRAIAASPVLGGHGLDGFEREINDEIALKLGQRSSGFWLPQEALAPATAQRNFVAGTPTLGGFLISTPNAGDQFIEVLRAKAVVVGMGARVLSLQNPITIPQQNAAGTTNWVTGTTAATLSTGNFTQITLSPKVLTAFQQYDKQLLVTSNPSVDALVRDDIAQIIARAIDLAALAGSGSPQPTGILGTTGINTVAAGTNGLALTGSTLAYPFIVSLESEIAADNAPENALGYVLHSNERGKLKSTPKFTYGDSVWEDGNTLNGYKTAISNQIVRNLTTGTATTICTYMVFGDWSELLVASFNGGATDLVVDPYTLAVNGVVRLIARHWCDIGVRHPVSFCAGGGIIA